MGHQTGFVLIEVLLSLFICSIVVSGLYINLIPLTHIDYQQDANYDIDILTKQLQQILATSSNIVVKENQLFFTSNQQSFVIELDQHRLVKKDGFEILLFNVDSIHFQKDSYIKMDITRGNKTFSRIIGVNNA